MKSCPTKAYNRKRQVRNALWVMMANCCLIEKISTNPCNHASQCVLLNDTPNPNMILIGIMAYTFALFRDLCQNSRIYRSNSRFGGRIGVWKRSCT